MTKKDEAKSRAERFARKAGAHLAKGKAPALSSDVVAYVDACADEVAITLDCFVQCINAGKPEDPIALGYLFLIAGQLEHLRYRMDKGFVDAIQRVEDFQTEVASYVDAGRMGAAAVSMIGSALQHAGVAASKTLIAAVETCAPDAAADDPGADFLVALDEMTAQCDSDPFALAGLLAEAGHAMPVEARAMMATALAASSNPAAREASVLQILDPEPSLRQAAAKALLSRMVGLSPDSLRRLIAMRNWAPETERDAVDALIRAARASKIECAPWRAGEETEIVLASSIDGSGAQGFLIVTKAGRRKRLSSVLVRTAILDAWSGPPESKARVRDALDQAAAGAAMAPVPRSYLDQVIR